MKRGNNQTLALILSLLLIIIIIFSQIKITGKVVNSEFQGNPGSEFVGIPEEEQRCMQSCVEEGCDGGDMNCMTGNRDKCMTRCGAKPAGQSSGEQCMNSCIDRFCTPGPEYRDCMNQYLDSCEEECDMKGDAPDESEMDAEQICISNCVAAEDSEIICGNSQQGETGNALCQRCAQECVHLYEGPCLDDAGITEKEDECTSRCEHCYGAPVEGPSGQGWDCIVDVSCEDASGEFGDDAGTGPGIGEEGYVNQEESEGFVANFFEGIGNFFKGLFGGGGDEE